MSDAEHVYISSRSLFLFPPGDAIVYHERGQHIFPTYVYDPETSAKVAIGGPKRVGEEYGYTRCGRLIQRTEPDERLKGTEFEGLSRWIGPMRAVRRDQARLLGRACRECNRPS